MTVTISTRGRFVLPAKLRQRDDIRTGPKFKIERIGGGAYRFIRTTVYRNQGLIKILLACPVKGWFKSAHRTRTTDDIIL